MSPCPGITPLPCHICFQHSDIAEAIADVAPGLGALLFFSRLESCDCAAHQMVCSEAIPYSAVLLRSSDRAIEIPSVKPSVGKHH